MPVKRICRPHQGLGLSYDLDKCLVEWEDIQSRLFENMWHRSGDGSLQTCLQRNSLNHRDPFTEGAGSFRNTGKIESNYNVLLELYEGTVFDEIIWDVDGVRARIMMKSMHTTYSVHSDATLRYHLALKTNPNAYFIFPTLNEVIHIPADGYVYAVDTTIPHSFVNCGEDRTHLVISKRS
tara:strand:- start:167 stop:706 length:540 start_codon:yes stop_codon:yes gene_type:complete